MASKNKDEQIEYEAKKPLLDAFKDLFKRPAALPGEIPSKHKVTNTDMQTSMNFREFRAKLMEKVGGFFQSLSNIGSPKKEESPNKYINTNTQENPKDNEKDILSKQPIRIPEQISVANVRTAPVVETINVSKEVVENINKTEFGETTFESDSSSDATPLDTDLKQETLQPPAPVNTITTGTIVTSEAEHANNKTAKHIVRKKSEADKGDREL